jgi:hypothetical protein
MDLTNLLTKEAASPTTKPDRLEQLALISDDLALLVAANPNASFMTLTALAVRFPQQVIHNPALNLLALEKAESLIELFNPAWRDLLDQANVPILILKSAALIPDSYVWYKVLDHLMTPLAVLEQINSLLISDQSPTADGATLGPSDRIKMLRLAVVQHPNASSELIDAGLHLFEKNTSKLFIHPNAPAWLGALVRSTPGVSARNLARFMRFKSPMERLRVAMYPFATADVLDELARSGTEFIALQEAIAENPGVSISTLERIAHHHKDDVALKARRQLQARTWRGEALEGRLFWPISVSHAMMNHPNTAASQAMLKMRRHRMETTKDALKVPPVRGGVYLLKLAGFGLVKIIDVKSTGEAEDESAAQSTTVRACHWYWQVKPIACENPRTLATLKTWVHELDVRRDLPGRVESWSLEEFDACEPFLLEVCAVKEAELEAVRNSRVEDIWNLPESLGGQS